MRVAVIGQRLTRVFEVSAKTLVLTPADPADPVRHRRTPLIAQTRRLWERCTSGDR
jgi:hypothetical protein